MRKLRELTTPEMESLVADIGEQVQGMLRKHGVAVCPFFVLLTISGLGEDVDAVRYLTNYDDANALVKTLRQLAYLIERKLDAPR